MEEKPDIATYQEIVKAVELIMADKTAINDLFKYGIYRLKNKFNITYDLERGFRGLMMEDMISELLQSFVSKDEGRNWNKTNFPEFRKQLLSAFDSHLCNSVNKHFDNVAATVSDEHIEYKELDTSAYNELINLCLETLESHGATYEELQLFEPYFINGMKRADVAAHLNMSVADVTKIKTKLTEKLPLLRNVITNSEL
ncbi:MAG: hypothetical protein ACO1O6_01645 [Bacteroidota bacterium]